MEGNGQILDDEDVGTLGRAQSPGLGDDNNVGDSGAKASVGMKVKSFPNPNVIQ